MIPLDDPRSHKLTVVGAVTKTLTQLIENTMKDIREFGRLVKSAKSLALIVALISWL